MPVTDFYLHEQNPVERIFRGRLPLVTARYTEVVIAQATALQARRALVQLLAERQTTAVALIQALGGGWHEGGG